MIQRWFEPFTMLVTSARPDSLGGQQLSFDADFLFQGVLSFTTGREITAGSQLLLEETPMLLHEFDVTLSPGDYVRREQDGAIYRVTGRSDNMRSPASSGLGFAQVPVERVVFPC